MTDVSVVRTTILEESIASGATVRTLDWLTGAVLETHVKREITPRRKPRLADIAYVLQDREMCTTAGACKVPQVTKSTCTRNPMKVSH